MPDRTNGVAATSRRAAPHPGAPGPAASSPAARRTTVRRWRDPRMWLGGCLVLIAVLAGSRILAASDDMSTVVTMDGDVAAGTVIGRDDLRTTRIRFDENAIGDRYFGSVSEVPAGAVAARDLARGDLLELESVAPGDAESLLEVPIGVDAANVPVGLSAGDRVDVWVVPEESATGPSERASETRGAEMLVEDATVLATDADDSVVGGGERRVLVGIPRDRSEVAALLGGLRGSSVVLVRYGR